MEVVRLEEIRLRPPDLSCFRLAQGGQRTLSAVAPRQLTLRPGVRTVSVRVAIAGSLRDSREGATRGQCTVAGGVA